MSAVGPRLQNPLAPLIRLVSDPLSNAGGRVHQEAGEVGGVRDPYVGVGGRDPALGGGDVGAPLQQLRREPGGDHRRRGLERRHRDRERGRRGANQRGDRVLETGPVDQDVDPLRPGGLEDRFRLRDVGLRRHAALEPVPGQLQRALERRYGGVENALLGIEAAQREVIRGQLRVQRQPDALEIRR